jgi:hypothetical protein
VCQCYNSSSTFCNNNNRSGVTVCQQVACRLKTSQCKTDRQEQVTSLRRDTAAMLALKAIVTMATAVESLCHVPSTTTLPLLWVTSPCLQLALLPVINCHLLQSAIAHTLSTPHPSSAAVKREQGGGAHTPVSDSGRGGGGGVTSAARLSDSSSLCSSGYSSGANHCALLTDMADEERSTPAAPHVTGLLATASTPLAGDDKDDADALMPDGGDISDSASDCSKDSSGALSNSRRRGTSKGRAGGQGERGGLVTGSPGTARVAPSVEDPRTTIKAKQLETLKTGVRRNTQAYPTYSGAACPGDRPQHARYSGWLHKYYTVQ